ncbi:hypothetical protein [Timonella sp. A28]|uniref:hypothetical protein n=1 Tax=Timonella sp. A28 TaxID=3442640 RepID=UPI003EBDEB98
MTLKGTVTGCTYEEVQNAAEKEADNFFGPRPYTLSLKEVEAEKTISGELIYYTATYTAEETK